MAEENINQGFSLKNADETRNVFFCWSNFDNVSFESAILINDSMAADSLAGDLA